jgi:hypothetical protein
LFVYGARRLLGGWKRRKAFGNLIISGIPFSRCVIGQWNILYCLPDGRGSVLVKDFPFVKYTSDII